MKKRVKFLIVNPVPYLKIDMEDETSAYGILALYVPWRKEGEWLHTYTSSVEALQALYATLPANIRQILDGMHKVQETQEEIRNFHKDNNNSNNSDSNNNNSKDNNKNNNRDNLNVMVHFNIYI